MSEHSIPEPTTSAVVTGSETERVAHATAQPVPQREWQPRPDPGRHPIYHLAGILLRILLRVYGRLKVVGRDNVPRTGGVLLASNHASYLDPMLIGAALYRYRRVWMMAKRDLWRHPVMRYVYDRVMAFPVERHSPDRAALRRALEWLAQGEAVLIFPEGERTRTGQLLPGLPGVALLALKSGVPVVPVACIGTYEMWPANRKSIRRVPLTLAFGTPLYFAPGTTREEAAAAIMRAIADLMLANGQPTQPPSA
jgi:1-acyl-sn-glycerol-3-phosphate acyltransferase